jgi:hypothetical protein
MRARFGIHLVCSITTELLTSIVERSAGILKMPISYEAALLETLQPEKQRQRCQYRFCTKPAVTHRHQK